MIEYRKAIVIDNNDPDKKGEVQVRVLPEMTGVDENKLPWCRPFMMSGGGGEGGTHDIPEIGEYVTVIIKDKFWIHMEYIPSDYTVDNYPYLSFESISSSMTELGSQTYPQPKYLKKFADGSFIFHNSSTGEHGIYNSNGTYILISSNGDIYISTNSGNKIEMTSSGVSINDGNLTILQ